MKILAVCSSGQKNGTNFKIIEKIINELETRTKITYEIVFLKDYIINPCQGCWGCYKLGKCVLNDDFGKLYKKLEESDIIILGTPVFYGNVNGMMKNYIDRHFGDAIDKLPGSEKYFNMTWIEKLKYKIKFSRSLKGREKVKDKKYILAINLNKPYLLGLLTRDIQDTLNVMKKFIQEMQGIEIGRIVVGDSYFGKKEKEKEITKKAEITANKILRWIK